MRHFLQIIITLLVFSLSCLAEGENGAPVQPMESIKLLQEQGIIVIETTRPWLSLSKKEKEMIDTSKELLQHAEKAEKGEEKWTAYPYVDKIIRLYRYRLKPDAKFPAGALQPFLAAGCKSESATLLHLACYSAAPSKEIKKLLKGKENVNAMDVESETPLHDAVRCRLNDGLVELLIKKGAEVNAANEDGWTPLHVAAVSSCSVKTIQVLLKSGANQGACDKVYRDIPLNFALRANGEKAFFKMLRAGMSIKTPNFFGALPLHIACSLGSHEAVAALIKAGSPLDVKNHSLGATPTFLALRTCEPRTIKLLIKAGGKVTDICRLGWNGFLQLASNKRGSVEIFNILIKENVDVNHVDQNKRVPLHGLAMNKEVSEDMVRAFLQAGARLDVKDGRDQTPLDVARSVKNMTFLRVVEEMK